MTRTRNRKKADRLWIGIVTALVVPMLMILFYFHIYNYKLDDFGKVMQFLAKSPTFASKFIMVCLLPDCLLIFVSYALQLWDTFKGVIAITMLLLAASILLLV